MQTAVPYAFSEASQKPWSSAVSVFTDNAALNGDIVAFINFQHRQLLHEKLCLIVNGHSNQVIKEYGDRTLSGMSQILNFYLDSKNSICVPMLHC
ncbi:hypothetical protein CEXT_526621 [Caerostris extrusa]|uniref:Uncharacterized protein n=1 Tax=Caerostris extrusa TaxID=172846 RepID=A0AAV4Y9G2_CAEEX|nr:hypothetical protein CEXT_526621 [Caerostris extrusa]